MSFGHSQLLYQSVEIQECNICTPLWDILYMYVATCIIYAKQKQLGCKKGETNQKQQLSDYGYIAILVTKSFDIKLRPRIN